MKWIKRLCLLLVSIGLLLTGCYEAAVYFTGKTYDPRLTLQMDKQRSSLVWSPYFLPCYYEVEVLASPPKGGWQSARPWQVVDRFRTLQHQLTLNTSYPFPTYWRVHASSLLQAPVGQFSEAITVKEPGPASVSVKPVRPLTTSKFPPASPASVHPFLGWTTVAGAVYYELELLSAPPENDDILPSQYRLFVTRQVFTNGYNADLRQFNVPSLYWRVRALDYEGSPIGVFSEASQIHIDPNRSDPLKPLPSSLYDLKGDTPPLYPVYSWIPVTGAEAYEVELTDDPPENPGTPYPSEHRIWSQIVKGFDCYDDTPRNQPGTYYWRVRALDKAGQAIGVYSDAIPVTIDLAAGRYAATFGDSITHGGGAVSYSPADWEYSYQSYLNFPQVNLGRSGDTSETMLERFDADVLPFQPKFLLILGGTNSLRGGVPASKVIADLAAIGEKCVQNNIRPIFLTLPPINPAAIDRVFQEEATATWRMEFDAVNQFIRQQRYYIEIEPYFLDENRELASRFAVDGLHLDIEGKQLIATIINQHWDEVTR